MQYQRVCYEEVKWKLADDVIFCHIICTWHLGWPMNIVERLQCLNILIFGYFSVCGFITLASDLRLFLMADVHLKVKILKC